MGPLDLGHPSTVDNLASLQLGLLTPKALDQQQLDRSY